MNKDLYISPLLTGEIAEDDSEELIQLISPEEEDSQKKFTAPDELSILPLKNTVLFPGVIIPITVGRKKSIKLVKDAYSGDRIIGVVAQKSSKKEDPNLKDIYSTGTIAKIVKMLVLPDGNTTIIIQGKMRFRVREFLTEDPFIRAKIDGLVEKFPDTKKKSTTLNVGDLDEESISDSDSICSLSF